jgi:hypothetical protein
VDIFSPPLRRLFKSGGRLATNLPLFSFWPRYPLAETLKLLAGLIVICYFSSLSGAVGPPHLLMRESRQKTVTGAKNFQIRADSPDPCGFHGRDGLVSEEAIWRSARTIELFLPEADSANTVISERDIIPAILILPADRELCASSRTG